MNEQLKKRILKNGYYTCNRRNMCKMLLKNGYELLDAQNCKTNPKFLVWIFKATPELIQDVEDWMTMVNNRKNQNK